MLAGFVPKNSERALAAFCDSGLCGLSRTKTVAPRVSASSSLQYLVPSC